MSELTTLFQNTADAIRSKTGDTATMQASQFPAKIQGISVGISQDEADARYLQLSGGTMTGDLILNGSPTADNQAATKQYVDNNSGGWTLADTVTTGVLASKTGYLNIPLTNIPLTAGLIKVVISMEYDLFVNSANFCFGYKLTTIVESAMQYSVVSDYANTPFAFTLLCHAKSLQKPDATKTFVLYDNSSGTYLVRKDYGVNDLNLAYQLNGTLGTKQITITAKIYYM